MTSKGFRMPRTPTEFIEAAGSLTTLPQTRLAEPITPVHMPVVPAPPKSAPEPIYTPQEPNARVKRQVNFELPEPDHHRLSAMVDSMSGRMSIRKFIVLAVIEKMDRIDSEWSGAH